MREAWARAYRLAREIHNDDHADDCDYYPSVCWCTCGLDERWEAAMEVPLFSEAYDCVWSRHEPDWPVRPSPLARLGLRALGLGVLDDQPF